MLFNRDFRFVYLGPQRTATQVVIQALMKVYKGEIQEAWEPWMKPFYHFITVRNPFPRMVSLWKKHSDFLGFREFVLGEERQEWLHQQRCYALHLSVPRVDRVVHIEHLHIELHALPFVQRPLDLPVSSKSGYERPWWEEYDDETIQRVRHLWADDFQAYDYRMLFEDALP